MLKRYFKINLKESCYDIDAPVVSHRLRVHHMQCTQLQTRVCLRLANTGSNAPETLLADYARLRAIIDKHADGHTLGRLLLTRP